MICPAEDFYIVFLSLGWILHLKRSVLEKFVLRPEFLVYILLCVLQRHIIKVEAQAERKHVLALHHALCVELQPCQSLLRHARDVRENDVMCVQFEFRDRVFGAETRPLDLFFVIGIAVYDHRATPFEPLRVCAQCSRVHRHKHVAVVARRKHLGVADVYLKSGNSRHRTLRCAYLGGIVGEGRDTHPHQCRSI